MTRYISGVLNGRFMSSYFISQCGSSPLLYTSIQSISRILLSCPEQDSEDFDIQSKALQGFQHKNGLPISTFHPLSFRRSGRIQILLKLLV